MMVTNTTLWLSWFSYLESFNFYCVLWLLVNLSPCQHWLGHSKGRYISQKNWHVAILYVMITVEGFKISQSLSGSGMIRNTGFVSLPQAWLLKTKEQITHEEANIFNSRFEKKREKNGLKQYRMHLGTSE